MNHIFYITPPIRGFWDALITGNHVWITTEPYQKPLSSHCRASPKSFCICIVSACSPDAPKLIACCHVDLLSYCPHVSSLITTIPLFHVLFQECIIGSILLHRIQGVLKLFHDLIRDFFAECQMIPQFSRRHKQRINHIIFFSYLP